MSRSGTIVVAGLEHDAHDTGPYHVERPDRVAAAAAALGDAGLSEAVAHARPRRATRDELGRVHGAEYLDALERFCAQGGGYLDRDTPVSSGSWDTALQAAGAGLAVVDALRTSATDAGFVIARPPGHHARPNTAMGFCLFNNIAVAAAALAAAGERVAIIDWDVHHGNGTQEIFWNDPRVLYVSTHQAPHYPFTGSVFETGGPEAPAANVNIPLPAGATGDIVLRAIDEVAAPAVAALDPAWVLVSAGYDAHRADPLADLRLTAGDFFDLAKRVAAMAPKIVLFLEGGYDLTALRLSVGATVGALTGVDYRPEGASNGGPGAEAVAIAQRVRERV